MFLLRFMMLWGEDPLNILIKLPRDLLLQRIFHEIQPPAPLNHLHAVSKVQTKRGDYLLCHLFVEVTHNSFRCYKSLSYEYICHSTMKPRSWFGLPFRLLRLAEICLRENIGLTDSTYEGKLACRTLFAVITQMGYLVSFHDSSVVIASCGSYSNHRKNPFHK